MLFSEVYSVYYNTVAKLIEAAIAQQLNERQTMEIIRHNAFSESSISILRAVKNEEWQILTKNYATPIYNKPVIPISLLQKRWLKSISEDARFKLFIDNIEGLDNVEPLYRQSDVYRVDISSDGDDYENPKYIKIFRTIIKALKESKMLKIDFRSEREDLISNIFIPNKLEYSQKDDKFRLIAQQNNIGYTINLGRIVECAIAGPFLPESVTTISHKGKAEVVVEVTDDRNALERAMLLFASYEKVTQQITDNKYQMSLTYYKDDETEVLIRILSFGPMLKVLSPSSFLDILKKRLSSQKKLR